jgi:geranylgeranyl transferase type-2 subunit beta
VEIKVEHTYFVQYTHQVDGRSMSTSLYSIPSIYLTLNIMSELKQDKKLKQLPDELQLATAAHVKYVQSLDTRVTEISYWMTEHLRLNGLYWGLVALHLLGHSEALPRDETIKFVLSCQKDNGGFAPAPNHHAHILYTVSAVQILAMVDGFDELEKHGKGNGKATVGKCEPL